MRQKGFKHSEETKKKMSLSQIGNRNAFGKYWKMSEVTKKKLSEYAKSNPPKQRFKKGYIPWNKGTKGLMPSGESHAFWIKDRNLLSRTRNARQDTAESITWSRKVKRRDNWNCKMESSDCNGRLESHHILPYRDFPELRYKINNGITLCHFHHPRSRKMERKLIPFFRELVRL